MIESGIKEAPGLHLKAERVKQGKVQKEFLIQQRTVGAIENSGRGYSIDKLISYAEELGAADKIMEAIKNIWR